MRIDKAARQGANRLRGKLRIGIQGDHDLTFCITQTEIQGAGFAGVRFGEEPHQRLFPKLFTNDFAGAIVRAVVHDDNLKVIVIGVQQAANRSFDHPLFVVSRHDDGDERFVTLTSMTSLAFSRTHPLRKGQRADQDQPPQA